MKNVALVDMDSTLCDYEGSLSDRMEEVLGKKASIHDHKGLAALIKTHPGFWRDLPVIELGMAIVEYLKKTNWEVHILTKGPYKSVNAWTEKVEWCRKHLPGTPVTITEDKSLVYGRILVDDWPAYCEAWLEWRPRGMVIMPEYYYNKNFYLEHPGRVAMARMNNLGDIFYCIDQVAKRKSGEH